MQSIKYTKIHVANCARCTIKTKKIGIINEEIIEKIV